MPTSVTINDISPVLDPEQDPLPAAADESRKRDNEPVASSTSTQSGSAHQAKTTSIELNRHHLTVRKHTREHALSILGPSLNNNEAAIQETLKKLDSMKRELRTWAINEIHATMIAAAHYKGLKDVRTFSDIRDWWTQNCDDEAQDNIGYIQYGVWDSRPNWELDLEQKYMARKGWTYKPTEGVATTTTWSGQTEAQEGKGFVACMIVDVKGDQVKKLQKAGSIVHGIVVRIKREACQINEENKWKKRAKGTFLKKQVEPKEKPAAKRRARKIKKVRVSADSSVTTGEGSDGETTTDDESHQDDSTTDTPPKVILFACCLLF